MICPKCGTPFQQYDNLEGAWCEHCEEWFPPDICEEREYENE